MKDGAYSRHTPVLTGDRKVRALSIDVGLLPHFGDALTSLDQVYGWFEVGDSPADIVAECKRAVGLWYSDMLVGMVAAFLVSLPVGWLLLDGSTYDGVDYPELYAILPTHLKNGSQFTLPDMTDAFPQSVALVASVGVRGGSNILNLTEGQLPSHSHSYVPPVIGADVGGAGPPLPSAVVGGSTSTGSTGSGDDVDKTPLNVGFLYSVFAGR